LVFAWRGTLLLSEWITNGAGDALKPWDEDGGSGVRVHMGFRDMYREAKDVNFTMPGAGDDVIKLKKPMDVRSSAPCLPVCPS
jgi:hypothetical protein